MKKIYTVLLSFITLVVLSTSCNKTPTYIDRLKDETKAIDKFIAKNNLVILKDYPADSTFKSNEFYKDPASGVYYNVIEAGVPKNRAKLGEEIYIRFSGLSYFMTKDTTKYTNDNAVTSPMPQTIIYRGPLNSSTRSLYTSSTPGWAAPLPHIGHGARVKMIVPFNMGSEYDRANYQPTYYDRVTYRFESQ